MIDKSLMKFLLTNLLVLLASSGALHAQSDQENVITKQFNQYQQNAVQEKIFVHTDRSSYVSGEIIWFKVYCVNAASNKPLGLSKVAYVEVLDKDHQPVLQAKIALQDGAGSGSFVLPSTIRSGNYLFRSYTNLMKNFDPEFYFHQNISIINTVQVETPMSQKQSESYDIQFSPEGGDLVADLKSKVGFRVTDNTGKGIDFNGAVVDQNNDTIVRFRPEKFGIGNFIFTPKRNIVYKAFIKPANATGITQNLPAARETGFVINVSDPSNNQPVRVNIATNTNDRSAYLVVHAGNTITASHLVNFSNNHAIFDIDKSMLADGISHITLFNANYQPVCERLYFKLPQQRPLAIEATTDASEYAERKKVTMNVGADDATANMSMAVYLLDSLAGAQQNIYDYLWMSSELKGIVESPSYYFGSNSDEVREALDNLMLTHGWRRFKWEGILRNSKPVLKFLPEYEGHIVSGKVVDRLTDMGTSDINGFLSAPGKHFKLFVAKSTADGSIHFNTKDFYGSGLIVAQANSEQNSVYRIDLANPFSESFASINTGQFYPSTVPGSRLLKRSIDAQVQAVYKADKLNTFQSAKIDTSTFYGRPEARYFLDDYTRFPTMEEVLREYVREVNVRKRRDEFVLTTVLKDENGNTEVKEPVVMLDGVPQFDSGNRITHYNPLKVKKLEIVKDNYFLGPAAFNGILSFSTYNGDLEGFPLDTASTVLDYDALQLKREFYSPVYDTNEQVTSRVPDFRNLLFWAPDVKTDDKGKKQISFYTSDIPGKYAIVIQGISSTGKAGSKIVTIDVKKEVIGQNKNQ
jgi:hypothetical protein